MGKRQVRVVVVRKPATFALLVLTSAAMAALLFYLSGRAYAGQADPLREMLTRALSLPRDRFLAFLMPVLANVLMFVPWGFLAFLLFDRAGRSRVRSYGLVCALGLVFAAGMHVWQQFLPTLVLTPSDLAANALGALGGAAVGHMRKRVHVRFDY